MAMVSGVLRRGPRRGRLGSAPRAGLAAGVVGAAAGGVPWARGAEGWGVVVMTSSCGSR